MKWSTATPASLRIRPFKRHLTRTAFHTVLYALITFRLCCSDTVTASLSVMTGPARATFQVPVQVSRSVHVLPRLGRDFDPKRKRVEYQYSTVHQMHQTQTLNLEDGYCEDCIREPFFSLGGSLPIWPGLVAVPCLSIDKNSRLQGPKRIFSRQVPAQLAYRGPKSRGRKLGEHQPKFRPFSRVLSRSSATAFSFSLGPSFLTRQPETVATFFVCVKSSHHHVIACCPPVAASSRSPESMPEIDKH